MGNAVRRFRRELGGLVEFRVVGRHRMFDPVSEVMMLLDLDYLAFATRNAKPTLS